jgi:DegV family protein with EDD domain
MAKIAFVTDSTTYMPEELLGKQKLDVAPSVVIWDGEELRDGVDIQPSEFYARLATASVMPTTSQATPGYFKEIYENIVKSGTKDIISLHVSTKLSGTVGSANQAAELVPKANVSIIDGRNCSMGTGWPLLVGMKAAQAGKSFKDVEKAIRAAMAKSGVLIMVNTLEFLHKGGRIGGAQRYLGAALNLKPILEVQDGGLEPLERVRTKSKAMKRLVDLVGERTGGKKPLMIAALHANAPEEAEKLLAMAKEQYNPEMAVITAVSPSVGTHTGPGTLGIGYMSGVKL